MITATSAGTVADAVFPIHLLYSGKHQGATITYAGFPADFDVWHSPNH